MKDNLIGTRQLLDRLQSSVVVSGNCPSKAEQSLGEIRESFGRGLREVRKGFGRCSDRFARGRERNELVIWEEIGQLGKQLTERRRKVVCRSRQRLLVT